MLKIYLFSKGIFCQTLGPALGSEQQTQWTWVFITGGCSGRGVQWMGVVLYNKLVYNII